MSHIYIYVTCVFRKLHLIGNSSSTQPPPRHDQFKFFNIFIFGIKRLGEGRLIRERFQNEFFCTSITSLPHIVVVTQMHNTTILRCSPFSLLTFTSTSGNRRHYFIYKSFSWSTAKFNEPVKFGHPINDGVEKYISCGT